MLPWFQCWISRGFLGSEAWRFRLTRTKSGDLTWRWGFRWLWRVFHLGFKDCLRTVFDGLSVQSAVWESEVLSFFSMAWLMVFDSFGWWFNDALMMRMFEGGLMVFLVIEWWAETELLQPIADKLLPHLFHNRRELGMLSSFLHVWCVFKLSESFLMLDGVI
jgi:hypothetical protein